MLVVNSRERHSVLMKDELEGRLNKIPFYQENDEEPVWSILNGDKDDVFVYDRCGRLAYYIPLPLSFLNKPYVQAAILSAYFNDPCGFCIEPTVMDNNVTDFENASSSNESGALEDPELGSDNRTEAEQGPQKEHSVHDVNMYEKHDRQGNHSDKDNIKRNRSHHNNQRLKHQHNKTHSHEFHSEHHSHKHRQRGSPPENGQGESQRGHHGSPTGDAQRTTATENEERPGNNNEQRNEHYPPDSEHRSHVNHSRRHKQRQRDHHEADLEQKGSVEVRNEKSHVEHQSYRNNTKQHKNRHRDKITDHQDTEIQGEGSEGVNSEGTNEDPQQNENPQPECHKNRNHERKNRQRDRITGHQEFEERENPQIEPPEAQNEEIQYNEERSNHNKHRSHKNFRRGHKQSQKDHEADVEQIESPDFGSPEVAKHPDDDESKSPSATPSSRPKGQQRKRQSKKQESKYDEDTAKELKSIAEDTSEGTRQKRNHGTHVEEGCDHYNLQRCPRMEHRIHLAKECCQPTSDGSISIANSVQCQHFHERKCRKLLRFDTCCNQLLEGDSEVEEEEQGQCSGFTSSTCRTIARLGFTETSCCNLKESINESPIMKQEVCTQFSNYLCNRLVSNSLNHFCCKNRTPKSHASENVNQVD